MVVLLSISIAAGLLAADRNSLAFSVGYLVVTTAYSLSFKRMLLVDVLTLAGLYYDPHAGGRSGDRRRRVVLAAGFLDLLLPVAGAGEALSSNCAPPTFRAGERIAGRGYRTEDQEIVAQAGMASAFSSALVLALYIDSAAVRELYPHPWMVWPLAPIVLYLTMRVWILARRDEMHDDPVVFIIRDWRSQIVVLIGAASAGCRRLVVMVGEPVPELRPRYAAGRAGDRGG